MDTSLRRNLVIAIVAVTSAAITSAIEPTRAQAAAAQLWPPFVLVAGLLLVGLAADRDGLFSALGETVGRIAPNRTVLVVASVAVIGAVTAVLNLDTSVAFVTPVLVYCARARDEDERSLLLASILCANAGSLLLVGSNLTNLIVLDAPGTRTGNFLGQSWAPALAALAVTGAVVILFDHRSGADPTEARDPVASRTAVLGPGAAGVVLSSAAVLLLAHPSLVVLGIGAAVTVAELALRRARSRDVVVVLGPATIVGLFALGVVLGTLGRTWSGPGTLLDHLDSWGTAALAAGAAVLVNNLPAAALLAARHPPRPLPLLVGLDLGPNLSVTGSLAWLLWLRAARIANGAPSWRQAMRIGAVAAPLSMAAALVAIALTGRS